MITKLQARIKQTLQSLIKFFTNAPFNNNDWKWVKDENQGVKMTTGKECALDYSTEIYNYYPLSYYTNFQSSKSSKGKKDSWDTSKLINLSNNMGKISYIDLQTMPNENQNN